jgi:dUTP pyrophosphatase
MVTYQNVNQLPRLYICIDPSNNSLLEIYKNHVAKHNNEVMNNPYPNAGFDLFVPNDTTIRTPIQSVMISMDIQCEMFLPDGSPTGYYLYPRSSMSKTPLVLANHVGIIDSGYRGTILGAFRLLDHVSYTVEANTRLLQICAPSLQPFLVEIVNELSSTERGAGGFGSTGR